MATRNLVPRATNEGSIGIATKRWAGGHFATINVGTLALSDELATPNGDSVYDLGSVTKRFKNIHAVKFQGTSTSSFYADLAERYTCNDTSLPIGTVISVCDDDTSEFEVIQCDTECDYKVLGVVSNRPGYLMNANRANSVITGLIGKVPVRIIGKIKKGDAIVSAGNGTARAVNDINEVVVSFGYATESNYNEEEKLVMSIIKTM